MTDGDFVGGPVDDAVTVVAELAANAEVHAAHPYEIRVVMIGSLPPGKPSTIPTSTCRSVTPA
ncbi:hypothetical protein [Actinoallomurus sp. NPDC050550]|uniref:hypothetical protein n=1 Tax=Actinoallomurus sp. NPDC050550 TaxID=3154937 RepID=UPI0033DCDCCC